MRDRDAHGSGQFGASRRRAGEVRSSHEGSDYQTYPEEPVQSPIGGAVRLSSPFGPDSPFRRVRIENEAGQLVKVFYVRPLDVVVGMRVEAGEIIGRAQDLSLV